MTTINLVAVANLFAEHFQLDALAQAIKLLLKPGGGLRSDVAGLAVNPAELPDFWRSGAGASALPNGAGDLTEAIRRNGSVGINTDPSAALDVVGTVEFGAYGLGNKTAAVLGKTEAVRALGVASDGTVLEVVRVRKFYAAQVDLSSGGATITHNLGLNPANAFVLRVEDAATGDQLAARVQAPGLNSFLLRVPPTPALRVHVTVLG